MGSSTTSLTRSFFGVNGETAPVDAFSQVPQIGAFLNSTSIRMVRYGGGVDSCNATTNTQWTAGLTGGIATTGCAFDIASFAQWCDSLTPHCVSSVGLPGENNDSAEDANIAGYIVHTLGFQPTYWSIGNEPISWTHYGIPWSKWAITDDSVPTGTAYAVDVRNAITAVRAVDSPAKFIGIQSYWCPDKVYTEPVAAIDGPRIAAIACHDYTSEGIPLPTTAEYFGSLIGSHNITTEWELARQHIANLCGSCSQMPVQISEYQGGPFYLPAPQDQRYYGAVWLAASLVQALDVGIPSVQLYELQGTAGCGFCLLSPTYHPYPQGVLYERVLSKLHGSIPVYNVSVSSSNQNLWATLLHDRSSNQSQLLFVNANVSHAATISLTTPFFSAHEPGSILSWNSSAHPPSTKKFASLPSSVTVPSLGLVLVTVNPGSAQQPPAHGPVPSADPTEEPTRSIGAATMVATYSGKDSD